MSLFNRVTTWVSAQILKSSDLNGEFNNLVNGLNNLDGATTTWTNVKTGTLNVTGAVTLTSALPIAQGGTASTTGKGLTLQKTEGTTTANTTTVSATYATCSLTTTITPNYSGSLIRITAQVFGSISYSATGKCALSLRIIKGASTVIRDFGVVFAAGSGSGPTNNGWQLIDIVCYDSPASASAVTYAVQIANPSGGTAAVNDTTFATQTSYIAAEEIGQ